jgi:hypothetical protein
MVDAKIVQEQKLESKSSSKEDIIYIMTNIIKEQHILGYTELSNVMNERSTPLIGKRKKWTPQNVRIFCIENNINIYL